MHIVTALLACSPLYRLGQHHGRKQRLLSAAACVGGLEKRGWEEDEASIRRLRGSEESSFQTKWWDIFNLNAVDGLGLNV